MKKGLCLLILLFCTCGALFGQRKSKLVNQTDSTGLRQGEWIIYGNDRPDSGVSPKGIAEKGSYVNGKKQGKWTIYQADGKTPKLICNYEQNHPFGSYQRFFENGVVAESGSLFYRIYIYDDTLKNYDQNKQLLCWSVYDKGVLLKKCCRDPWGKMDQIITCHQDEARNTFQPTGYNELYNEQKVLWMSGTFKDGKLYDGKILPSERFENGMFWIVPDDEEDGPKPIGDSLNQRDMHGRKQGYWIWRGEHLPAEGIPLSEKVEEGSYLNNRRIGFWIEYHNDGVTPKLKQYYENGFKRGAYEKYDVRGRIKERGIYAHRETDSTTYFDTLGNEIAHPLHLYEDFYKAQQPRYYELKGLYPHSLNLYDSYGLKQGHWIIYGKDMPGSDFADSAKVREGEYINDMKQETWTWYHPDGTIKRTTIYTNDVPLFSSPHQRRAATQAQIDSIQAPHAIDGRVKAGTFRSDAYNVVYDKNDEIWMSGTFKNGKLFEGIVYCYNENGVLSHLNVFTEGNYHHRVEAL